jgi:hypothetical protein
MQVPTQSTSVHRDNHCDQEEKRVERPVLEDGGHESAPAPGCATRAGRAIQAKDPTVAVCDGLAPSRPLGAPGLDSEAVALSGGRAGGTGVRRVDLCSPPSVRRTRSWVRTRGATERRSAVRAMTSVVAAVQPARLWERGDGQGGSWPRWPLATGRAGMLDNGARCAAWSVGGWPQSVRWFVAAAGARRQRRPGEVIAQW